MRTHQAFERRFVAFTPLNAIDAGTTTPIVAIQASSPSCVQACPVACAVRAPHLRATIRADVAAIGSHVMIRTEGGWESQSGTSASTPQWAGIIALANSVRLQAGKSSLGPVNPLLYVPCSHGLSFNPIRLADISMPGTTLRKYNRPSSPT